MNLCVQREKKNTWKVKNALTNSVFCVTKYTIRDLVAPLLW
jgi:hypothetical protein